MSNISLVSGKIPSDIQVKVGDEIMSGVTKIEIKPITRNSGVIASITVNVEKLNVSLDDIATLPLVKK